MDMPNMTGAFKGFVPIHTMFYSVFHPTQGTKIRCEFPPGSLAAHDINFDTIKNYVIPKSSLCHRLLTLKYRNYRIAGYPVTVNSPKYSRNFFSFNFVFVFPYDCETCPYESVIVRLGKMFHVLEEQNQLLSKAEQDDIYFNPKFMTEQEHTFVGEASGEIGDQLNDTKFGNVANFSIQDLIMRVYQDLNNYSECLIPIDEGNAVDVKIFPALNPPSSHLSFEDVPIPTVNLEKLIDVNWDPTMLQIVPYIDGLNSISKLATLSDSDPGLVLECIKHLIYYGCITLSDIFQFSNIYAPTSYLRAFLTEPKLATECQSYVILPKHSKLSTLPFEQSPEDSKENGDTGRKYYSKSFHRIQQRASTSCSSSSVYPSMSSSLRRSESSLSSSNTNTSEIGLLHHPTKSCLFDLYRSLSHGLPLKEWYKIHLRTIQVNNIDIRRLITFGVVRGLIYRCQAHPIMKNYKALDILDGLENIDVRNSNQGKYKWGNVSKSPSNIFSTSDIKFDGGSKKENRNRRSHVLHLDVADDALEHAYQKLSLGHIQSRHVLDSPSAHSARANAPKGILIPGLYADSKSISQEPKRLSFPQDLCDSRKTVTDQTLAADSGNWEPFRNHINEEAELIKSLKNVETFDQICVKLQKPKIEVEKIIEQLGDYNIINT